MKADKYIAKYEQTSLKEKVKFVTVSAYLPIDKTKKEDKPEGRMSLQQRLRWEKEQRKKHEKIKLNFYYHVPSSYDPNAPHKYRVMIYCLYNGSSGEMGAAGKRINFNDWADKNGIFIVCLGGNGVSGKTWKHPEIWSGKALWRALKKLRKMYNIRSDRLLFYGFSAGSETSNLFPAAYPKQTVAYVSHGCGQFHEPTKKLRKVPALITCGDADKGRYSISRRFVRTYRKMGANIIFKTFPNQGHTAPWRSVELAKEFLLYHHLRNIKDLTEDAPELPKEQFKYVGDDVDGVYYDADAFDLYLIEPEERVYLPTEEIAQSWGKYKKSIFSDSLVATASGEAKSEE